MSENHASAATPLSAEPPVSVVIPTYNRKESLRRTLQGLSRQTLGDLAACEVLVVSDGSTDGTEEMLTEMAAAAGRDFPFLLRPVFQKNQGPSRARNRGIQEARGEIVVFIDDDVEPVPEFLEKHLRHHREDPAVAVVGPMSPDPANRANEAVWIGWEHAMLEKQYHNFRTGIWPGTGPNHFYSGNASVRREHLLAVNGFDESFTRQEDVEMAYRLERECGMTFRFDAEAVGLHRPIRSLESWLKVPYAYGKLDVVRASRGDVSWDVIRYSYEGRNRLSRLVMDASLSIPGSGPWFRRALVAAAGVLYRARRDGTAFGLMSAVFNMRYIEGVGEEMRDPGATRRVLRGTYPTATAEPALTKSPTPSGSTPP